jgi:hypothetical protein
LQRQPRIGRPATRDASHLWTGARLAAVEARQTALKERLTQAEQAFLAAGRSREWRNRFGTGAAILVGIGALVLAFFVYSLVVANTQVANERDNAQQARQTAEQAGSEEAIARQTAEQAGSEEAIARQTAVAAQAEVAQLQRETLSRRLAEASQRVRDTTPGFALTLAIEALRVAETWEADDATRSWLNTYNVQASLPHDDEVWGATWNADDTRILTWSDDGHGEAVGGGGAAQPGRRRGTPGHPPPRRRGVGRDLERRRHPHPHLEQ